MASLKDIYDVLAKEKQEQASFGTQYAKLPRGRVAAAVMGDIGGMLAGQAAEAMGYQTPGQQQAQAMEEVKALHPNPTTYNDFVSMANEFKNRGMMEAWEKIMDVAQTVKSKEATPGSAEKNIEYFAKLNQCNQFAAGSEEHNTCMQKSLQDAKDYKRLTAQEKYEGKYATKLADMTVERNEALISSAETAVQQLQKTNRVLTLLDEGEVNTGIFAEFQTNIDRVLAAAGSDRASKYASRTQLLESLLGSDVFPMIKQLGIGARGLDTPAEREFLLKVMTGEKKMNAETIREMTEIRQRLSKVIIEKYNKKIGAGHFDRYYNLGGEKVEPIDLELYEYKPSKKIKGGGPNYSDEQKATFDKYGI